ncbi:CDK5 regulatory subunit-associated protein 2 isoform X2 [Tachysurus fulvidraco]|uniref:CDK5 regulatory subunit-associated protein 2 isoform X2 n=1 Tax=Tachysurus fulvidraco TaxID=1234273 RepID=UPI001FEF5B3A|nr:CDK5 regulatory subunit-associated protein 2 isoform X2 [Tachysurus fulvidraco]
MWEPCRVCGDGVPGAQRRTLFNTCGHSRPAVVLAHVLGCNLHRDGRSELLCGKCMFLLECVVRCDITIEDLQKTHTAQLQVLQCERSRLGMIIMQKYWRNNLQEQDWCDTHKTVNQEFQHQSAREHGFEKLQKETHKKSELKQWQNEAKHLERSKSQHNKLDQCLIGGTTVTAPPRSKITILKEREGQLQQKNPSLLRRNASLGFGRSFLAQNCRFSTFKADRIEGAGVSYPSHKYSDLINKKSALPSCTVSVSHTPAITTLPRLRQTQTIKGRLLRLSDLPQLLQSIRPRPLQRTMGTRIPIKLKSNGVFEPADIAKMVRAERTMRELEEAFNDEYLSLKPEMSVVKQDELNTLEQRTRQLTEELNSTKSSSQTLKQRLEEMDRENKTLSGQLEERELELAADKKNALKRDKTIQGLSILLKEKERQVDELYGNLEEKEQALTKAREALHKAHLQKYQGGEEQQALLQSQHAELSRLQAECHSSLLELQRLQRALSSKDAQMELLQQDKLQLENELELLQQHKRKGDKTINDLQNQLKKLSGELAELENLLEHQSQAQQEQNRTIEHKMQSTVQHLTTSLTKKEQQLQEYMSMVQDLEQDRASTGSDVMLAKLREKLREKEKALEKALEEKFVAVEEKENEIHLLQLSMREKERDLERLNNLLTHNEETVNSFDALLKEKDLELQQLLNSLKNLQRSKQESEENLQRALREKDSIIQQLKTKDMEDMASTVLSQPESHGDDLAEQTGQRLKVTEDMLAEAVKHRERLLYENQTAVENLLASISSKDQLLKENAERHTQALSDRAAELLDLRRQLADSQLQLSNAQNLSAALNEKDVLINKLLDRAQEREHCLSETKAGEAAPPQVVELRHTIKVLQQRLEEKEAELSQQHSEENMEKSLTVNKKPAVILKKELAQKTDALNSALKRENQLKMSLAELQSTVTELEGRIEGQTTSIESLKSTISTKDEIISELQEHLALMGMRQSATTHDHHSHYAEELSFRFLPQRERTIIGGDRQQQQEMSSLGDLCSEQAQLNHILREEQHLYTKLVHAVKEQDSAQRLQALQLELTAVTLLRQQLEDGVRNNNELREQLCREIQRVNQREGVDPAELENMRDALEEAQRWNTSLQARLGQIQSRGGGVGQANDMDDTLSLIGDQTSYMSICVGEKQDEDLQHLSVEQLRLMVSELQAKNAELQKRLAMAERDIMGNAQRESQEQLDHIGFSPASTQPQGLARPLAVNANKRPFSPSVKETGDDILEAQRRMACSPLSLPLNDNGNSPYVPGYQGENEQAELASLLRDCGAESVSQLREQINKLRSEMTKLGALLKEENSAESKESAESSGENDSNTNLHRTVQTLRSEARSHRKVVRLLKEQLHRNAKAKADGGSGIDAVVSDSVDRRMERLREEHEATLRHAESLEDRLMEIQNRERNEGREQEEERERKKKGRQDQSKKLKHGVYTKSRLPVAVRPAKQRDRQRQTYYETEESSEQLSTTDSEQLSQSNRVFSGAVHQSSPGSSFEALWDSEPRRSTHPGTKQNSDARQNLKNVSDFPQSELLSQLELLNLECQEKEAFISKLQFQMQNLEELQAELQEKERLNGQYLEALHAAESTIAYLTACNLDSESGLGQASLGSDSSLQRQCTELQKAVQEKDQLNIQLLECLNTAEAAIASLTSTDQSESAFSCQKDPQSLCERLEFLLNQIKALQDKKQASTGTPKELLCPDGGSASDLQRQAETLQESLLQQCRLNAELQEKLRTAEETITKLCAQQSSITNGQELICTSPQEDIINEYEEGQQRLAACLSECIFAAEQAAGSLADYHLRTDQILYSPETNTELEQNLDRLQKALLERDRFVNSGSTDISHSTIVGPFQHKPVQHTLQISAAAQQKTSTPISQGQQGQQKISETWDPDQSGRSPHLNLHKNLNMIFEIFKQHAQKIQELEEALKVKQDLKGHSGLKHEDVAQLENLQKALKEKQKMCQKLEEKLASAQSIIALQNSSKSDKHSEKCKAPHSEQDDKGIQVDTQDLGYETSGRSETEVEREEGSSTDVDGGVCLDPALSEFTSADNLDMTASSPSYPSSPDLSSPRLHDPNSDPTHELLQLRSQVKSQQKVIAQLQRLLPIKCLTAKVLTSDPAISCEEEAESATTKARISQLSIELERERTINRSNESASPSRMESLVQSQARELCELREQIRVSQTLGAEQRKQLLDLRGAIEELMQPNDGQSVISTTLQKHLDRSLSLLDKLEQGSPVDLQGLELFQRFTVELQEKEKVIRQLKDQLLGKVPSMHQELESEMSDGISNSSTVSVHDSLHDLHTLTASGATEGLKSTGGRNVPDADTHPSSVGVAGDLNRSQSEEGNVYNLQKDNSRLQKQLRKSEELNATLRSELDLTHSILTHTQSQNIMLTKHTQSSSSVTHKHSQSRATDSQQAQHESVLPSISSDLLMEHLQEVRALRQRLEETIHTNERLREQLERKLQQADRDPADTHIFIAGSEDASKLNSDVHYLWAQNHTLKEQLNQAARDKQKENDCLRETLSRRTAKLDLSRKECEMLREERTHLQNNLYRLQCEQKLQKQQLVDTQQLLQSVQVELQVHEQIRNSVNTHTEERGGSESSDVDLRELLSEVRRLRLQLERSIQTNTALRHKLEQQLLTQTDPPSTININYLLPQADEGSKSEMQRQHSHTDPSSAAYDSCSSVRGDSPALSRLVPGHRLWADRHGRHVLGLIEDYSALSKQIREAKRITAAMDKQLQDRFVECAGFSGSVSTMQQVLEEAGRLLKLLWRVSLPTGDLTHTQQNEVLRSEITQLKSRLTQQERMLTGTVKRLRSTNQLKEGMERIIIEQLSLTHRVLKKARGNLESKYFNVLGIKDLQMEGNPTECPVTSQQSDITF